MRTTLHIGTTKTGSTSIQTFMSDNRARVLEHGTLYPKSLGKGSHNAIKVQMQGRYFADGQPQRFGIIDQDTYDAFQPRVTALLRDEIAQTPDIPQIVISSEHMHSRCINKTRFARLRTLLEPALKNREVKVVVYLRPQISHVVSLYSTLLRHGLDEDINSFVAKRLTGAGHNYFNFRKLLRRWANAFGNDALDVRAFNDVKALPRGVLSDFAPCIGLPDDPGLIYPGRVNESMNTWGAEVLHLLNGEFAHLPEGTKKKVRKWLRANLAPGRVRPDPELAQRFQKNYRASNAWVIKHYLPGSPDALSVGAQEFAAPEPAFATTPLAFLNLVTGLS